VPRVTGGAQLPKGVAVAVAGEAIAVAVEVADILAVGVVMAVEVITAVAVAVKVAVALDVKVAVGGAQCSSPGGGTLYPPQALFAGGGALNPLGAQALSGGSTAGLQTTDGLAIAIPTTVKNKNPIIPDHRFFMFSSFF
jgi:hypothetical protein